MRHRLLTFALLLCAASAGAQNIEYTTDEECGCELVVVDGIETTRSGDLYGFRLLDGTIIAENRYMYVDRFHGDYCKVYADQSHCGLLDRTGREVLPCLFDDINYPSEGRILAIRNGLVGYYDLDGTLAIPHMYPYATDFHDSLAAIVEPSQEGVRCAYIDAQGNRAFDSHYEMAEPFCEGYAVVRQDGLWGVIDHSGRYVLQPAYTTITPNQHGRFLAGSVDSMALFDYTMRPLTPFVYTAPGNTVENRTSVMRDGKYGFLDERGHEAVPCLYDEVGIFQQGRTQVRIGTRYGIVDTTGRVILPIEYDNTYSRGYKYMYYDGRAMVEKDGRTGYVDLEGNLVIPMYFEQAYQFSQGLAAVKHEGMWGYIDTAGEVYMPFVFDVALPFHWGRAEVVYNGNVSKVDLTGRCVKNCKGVIAWREIFK